MNPLAKPKNKISELYFNTPVQILNLIGGNLNKRGIDIDTNVLVYNAKGEKNIFHLYIPSKNTYIQIYNTMANYTLKELKIMYYRAKFIQPEHSVIILISIDTPIEDLKNLTRILLDNAHDDTYRHKLSQFAAKTFSYLQWNNGLLQIPTIYKCKDFNKNNLDLNSYQINGKIFFNTKLRNKLSCN